MNWKEFFKPNDFKKIFIAYIIFGIIALFSISFPVCFLRVNTNPYCKVMGILSMSYWLFIWPAVFFIVIIPLRLPFALHTFVKWIIGLFFMVFYWYLLACLTYKIYSKFKK